MARLEELDFSKQKLTREEKALQEVRAALVKRYDEERHRVPEQPPNEMVKYLMEQPG